MAELAGVTEEQADEMILFAEESAERVEEENRLAKAAEAVAKAAAPETAPAAPKSAAEQLFGAEKETAPAQAKPTLETLFGPDTGAPRRRRSARCTSSAITRRRRPARSLRTEKITKKVRT